MHQLIEDFASHVFTPEAMRRYVPETSCLEYEACLRENRELGPELARDVANGMRDWAVSLGATHYTHWFQPMTGITAEKHEAFLEPRDGKPALCFSASSLIREEPDASSFPSGGLRSTFEARGYTVWDPSSYAFVKGKTLCIPTAFCSYGGDALDMKTPLLRSMDAVNRQALRVLRALGDRATRRVVPMAGAEQEYFLIDQALYDRRPDLLNCRRTLIGNAPAKGQELNDHYFAAPKPRIQAFMAELDHALWRLGIYAKTEHNEVAPNQFELAPYYTELNLAADQNQLVMEMMQQIAPRHGLRCILHEKPFAGVNGSGKHLNWSLATDAGVNLLDPGDSPHENRVFLTFLTAILKALDDHPDLMRYGIAGAGNDHRLGGDEAPPAIISAVLGTPLERLLDDFVSETDQTGMEADLLSIGAAILPRFAKDQCDRNRTSPFAFTGNKFEFRMPGAKQSVALPAMILTTIVADSLGEMAAELEPSVTASGAVSDPVLFACLRRHLRRHRRILFSGNNYSSEWSEEAQRRGLPVYASTADVIPFLRDERNYELFARTGVFSRSEWTARAELCSERYCLSLQIEGRTLIKMLQRGIFPALFRWQGELAANLRDKTALSDRLGEPLPIEAETVWLRELAHKTDRLKALHTRLISELAQAESLSDATEAARYHRDVLLGTMRDIRRIADRLEALCPADIWPYPGYSAMLLAKS